MLKAFWKQFAGSATGFAYKYRHDVFYRTGWNVVILQVGFATVLLIIVVASLNLLYDEIVQGLVSSIASTIASGASPTFDSISIATNLEYEKLKNIVFAATGILIAAAIFSWLITRMALTPTRNALDSQKQFVGNIAHELRTPLSIIKTNTEVALFNERLDDETRETLISNVEELDRISHIINNLLSMSALLRPERMDLQHIDIGPVVERAVDVLSELAARKNITVEVILSEHRMVRGNPAALEQIVTNILKNAIAYTNNGGTVRVDTRPNYLGQLEVLIEDSGIGIPENELSRIFEPFYRGDQSRNRKSGGSGLGLAIVSELVKIHKGRISIRSTPGEGTIVSIMLPLVQERTVPGETAASKPEVVIDFSNPSEKA